MALYPFWDLCWPPSGAQNIADSRHRLVRFNLSVKVPSCKNITFPRHADKEARGGDRFSQYLMSPVLPLAENGLPVLVGSYPGALASPQWWQQLCDQNDPGYKVLIYPLVPPQASQRSRLLLTIYAWMATRESLIETDWKPHVARSLPLIQNSITGLHSGSRRLTAHLQEVATTF